MKSKTIDRILKNTPIETFIYVDNYVNNILFNKEHVLTEDFYDWCNKNILKDGNINYMTIDKRNLTLEDVIKIYEKEISKL